MKQVRLDADERHREAMAIEMMSLPETLVAYHRGTFDLGAFCHVDAKCQDLERDKAEIAKRGGTGLDFIGIKVIPLPEALHLRGACKCVLTDVAASTWLRQRLKERIAPYPDLDA